MAPSNNILSKISLLYVAVILFSVSKQHLVNISCRDEHDLINTLKTPGLAPVRKKYVGNRLYFNKMYRIFADFLSKQILLLSVDIL